MDKRPRTPALQTLGRWRRSLFRRLAGPINSGGTLMLQGVPLAFNHHRIDFCALRRQWISGNPKGNDLDLSRMAFLALNITALQADAVPGAFAEVGVWRGHSAKTMRMLAPDRHLYLFDSFSGFDRADAGENVAWMVHFRDTSAAAVSDFVGDGDTLHLLPGHFPDTAVGIPQSERFAFVQIDCDLEAPTRAALEFFYLRMVPRGLVVVHDYGSGRWPGVAHAVDEFMADKPEALLHIPDVSGSVAFRRFQQPA